VWAKVSNFWSFIGIVPVVLVYGLLFYLIIVRSPVEDTPDFRSGLLADESSSTASDTERSEKVENVSVWDCSYFGENKFLIFNCGVVYFLEYVMQTLFADCSLERAEKDKYNYFYPLLNLSYQVGVFLSRSSLSFFVVNKVWILTLCQCGFFLFWMFQAALHFMSLTVMWLPMVFVGLFGGCAYVNAFNLMMNDRKLTLMQREMLTSYNSFFIAAFVFGSTLFTYIAEQTFMVPE
jgi:battenin